MVDGIGMALTSLKAASDLTKSLIELRDVAKISEVSIELNGKIAAAQQLAIAAQGEQTVLIQEIDNLKKKIVEFENWEREKQRYELKELQAGSFAFALKEDMQDGQPAHYLCASCYENGKKEILQGSTSGYGRRYIKCKICQVNIHHSQGGDPPQTQTRRTDRFPI